MCHLNFQEEDDEPKSFTAQGSFGRSFETPNSHRIDPGIHCRACKGQRRSPHPGSSVMPVTTQIRGGNLQNVDNARWYAKNNCYDNNNANLPSCLHCLFGLEKRALCALVTAPSSSLEMAQQTLRSSTAILLDWWRAAWKIFP